MNETAAGKGTVGLIAAIAGLTISALESVKLGLQIISLALSIAIAILTLISLARSLSRSRDKSRSQAESDANNGPLGGA